MGLFRGAVGIADPTIYLTMVNPSPFPPKPGPPPEPKRFSRGFPGPVPRLEGRVAGTVRLVWNFALSATIGIMIGVFGTAILGEFVVAAIGPMGRFAYGALVAVGWIAGIVTAAILFMAYYLDDSEQ